MSNTTFPKLIGFKECRAITGLSTYEILYLIESGVFTPVVPVKRKRKLIHQQVVEYMTQLYERTNRTTGKPVGGIQTSRRDQQHPSLSEQD